jgi:hypothetical protein
VVRLTAYTKSVIMRVEDKGEEVRIGASEEEEEGEEAERDVSVTKQEKDSPRGRSQCEGPFFPSD